MIQSPYVAWPCATAFHCLPLLTAWMISRARRSRGAGCRLRNAPHDREACTDSDPSHPAGSRQAHSCALLIALAFAGPRWGTERTIVRQLESMSYSHLMRRRRCSPGTNRQTGHKDEGSRRAAACSVPSDRSRSSLSPAYYVLSPATIDNAALNLFSRTWIHRCGQSAARSRVLRQANNLLGRRIGG